MQEINLLQSKLRDRTETWERKNFLVSGFFAILVVAVLTLGGVFYFMNKNTKTEADRIKTENVEINNKLKSNQGQMATARALQAQFQNIEVLSEEHVFWTPILNEIQAATLKRTQFTLLTTTIDGKAHIEGLIDNLEDLSKLILGLSTNEELTNVKILSFNLSQDEMVRYKFAIEFGFKRELLGHMDLNNPTQ